MTSIPLGSNTVISRSTRKSRASSVGSVLPWISSGACSWLQILSAVDCRHARHDARVRCYHIGDAHRGTRLPGGFTIASFDSMRSVNLISIVRPSSAQDVRDLTDNQMAARERVARALDALGGHGSPAGSCVWHVVGMQTSIREWALRQGWGGRPVRQESAQGSQCQSPGHHSRRNRTL